MQNETHGAVSYADEGPRYEGGYGDSPSPSGRKRKITAFAAGALALAAGVAIAAVAFTVTTKGNKGSFRVTDAELGRQVKIQSFELKNLPAINSVGVNADGKNAPPEGVAKTSFTIRNNIKGAENEQDNVYAKVSFSGIKCTTCDTPEDAQVFESIWVHVVRRAGGDGVKERVVYHGPLQSLGSPVMAGQTQGWEIGWVHPSSTQTVDVSGWVVSANAPSGDPLFDIDYGVEAEHKGDDAKL